MGATDLKTAETAQGEEVPRAEPQDAGSIKDHWKCLAACTLVSMCPFQYGIDFGLIGGLQAMIGFLQVKDHACPCMSSRVSSHLTDIRRSTATKPRRRPWDGI